MKLPVLVLGTLVAATAFGQFYGYKDMPVPGQRRVATDAAGVGVRVDQKLNDFVPLSATFKDEEGQTVTLANYFNRRPVVVVPIFYKCTGVCDSELHGLVNSVGGFKRDFIGREFDVVTISIDPTETPTMAATKKDQLVSDYLATVTDRSRRIMTERGWHFLTGDEANIRKVTDALGFVYTYDKSNGSIVHPTGIMVLTPGGKISRYFVTTEYPQRVLLDSIRDAGKNLVGVKDDRPFFLACVQIDPLTGQRSLNVINALKTLGVLTVIALLVSILVWNRKYKAEQGGTV
ncbi:MAG: SCO family protein [Armatimonadetes bacterium]|nr:SCO family protein [Armatimonadota bacterium]